MDHVADVSRLCVRVEVIELQDHGIDLPALDARVLKKKLRDKLAIRIALHRIVPLISLEVRSLVVLIMLLRSVATADAAP